EQRAERRIWRDAQLTEGMDTGRLHLLAALTPEPGQPAHRQWVEDRLDTLFRDDGQAVRLIQVGGDLRDELVRGDSDRCGEACDFFDPGLDAAGDGDRVPEERLARCDVQKRLIQG